MGNNSSQQEQHFINFIDSLNLEYRTHDTSTIQPLELDVYFPELKIAIEFNGDHWHSDKMLYKKSRTTAREYHLLKMRTARRRLSLVKLQRESKRNLTSRRTC